jgi:hypothetical protein
MPMSVAAGRFIVEKGPGFGAILPRLSGAPCYPRSVRMGLDILLAGLTAAATALLLALIARDDIGMPPDMIREDALLGVGFIIAAMVGTSFRRRRQ